MKYGIRDHRGGGRSSGRETIGRVASGAIAKQILSEKKIQITAYTKELGGIVSEVIDLNEIENNPVRSPDKNAAVKMENLVIDMKAKGNSVGGIVELIIKGVPAGIGDPVFYKLDARLGLALISLGSVKGIEFGLGFQAVKLFGSQNNDQMKDNNFTSNNSGGILGGISNGEDIIVRIAVKPTPSIYTEQSTVNKSGENTKIKIEGRHDPIILPRIIPVIESMAALVILDAIQIQDRIKKT